MKWTCYFCEILRLGWADNLRTCVRLSQDMTVIRNVYVLLMRMYVWPWNSPAAMQHIGSAEGDPVAWTLLYHSCLPYTPAYVHLLTDTLTEFLTDGGSVTFDTSSPDHDPRADHPWHHALSATLSSGKIPVLILPGR